MSKVGFYDMKIEILTEQSINTTRGTNKRDARICNRMKERATYNTNNINYCHSHPLKMLVSCCTF